MANSSIGDSSICVNNLGKCYRIFNNPQDRLKQAIWGGRRVYHHAFWALRNISFKTKPGETLGIIGRNGSGKSTLLQLICGTLAPTEGGCLTRGSVAALLELGSGFNPEFSGIENIFLNAALLGLGREATKAKLDDILAFADIGDFAYQPVKTYSSGMQLRLAFAVITQADADILVIDEALAVGDAIFTQRCMRFINHCRETKSLLFVSHDAGSIAALTDRALWLNKGKIEMLGPTRDVLPHYVNFCQRLSGAQKLDDEHDNSHGSSLLETVENLPTPMSNNDSARPASFSQNSDPAAHPSIVFGKPYQDFRQELVNYEILEMAYKPSDFTGGNSSSHNDGRCTITDVRFEDQDGRPLSLVKGGCICRLIVQGKVLKPISSPILGFAVLDRRGQVLFGENTFGNGVYRELAIRSGEDIEAEFLLNWPWLASGEYSISAAIGSGGKLDHVNHSWINEGVILTSTPGTRLVNGIFSPPILDISLKHSSHSSG